jgi:transcriptional regulator with XRE-family HTH domain
MESIAKSISGCDFRRLATLKDCKSNAACDFGRMSTFGEKLKKMMQRSRFSQSRLAREIGTYQSVVNRWINGKGEPSLQQLLKMARLLGTSMEYLVDESIEEEPGYLDYVEADPQIEFNESLYAEFVKTFSEKIKAIEAMAERYRQAVEILRPLGLTIPKHEGEAIPDHIKRLVLRAIEADELRREANTAPKVAGLEAKRSIGKDSPDAAKTQGRVAHGESDVPPAGPARKGKKSAG